ncbi:formylmethanofuran dehydrogenase [Candidatus Bipolaricaulota bacterium]|nr:formylmethanofuran dehydrogenase [Candidatus Bipolaricaulota bacterium]
MMIKCVKRDELKKIEEFRGFLSPGALIGAYMFNIAKKVLNVDDNEKIFAICEGYNCIIDAVQVLGKSTVGNGRLKIKDTGKMAVTVNKAGDEGEVVEGVRIILDPQKAIHYPRIYEWYMNSKKFPSEEINDEIMKARENIYTWKKVNIRVPKKPKKRVKICRICGEAFLQNKNEKVCISCMEGETVWRLY